MQLASWHGHLDETGNRLALRLRAVPAAVPAARALSRFGEHAGGWLVLGAVGAVAGRDRSSWLRATTSVALAHGLNVAVKQLVRRPRPVHPHLPALVSTPSTLSFPSAHAASTFAAVVAFSPLAARARGPLLIAGLCMAISRLVLGVHYATDVLAGAALGSGVGYACGRRRPYGR